MKTSITVAVDARYALRSDRRGIGKFLYHLLREFSRTDHNFHLKLYTDGLQVQAEWLTDHRFELRHVHSLNPLDFEFRALPMVLKREKPDICHFPANYGTPIKGIPTIFTLHDVIEWHRKEIDHGQLSWRHRAGRAVRIQATERYIHRAWRVVADSDFAAADIKKVLRIDEQKIAVINPGLTIQPIAITPHEAREQLRARGYLVPEIFAFALGADDPRKRSAFLLEVFRHWSRRPAELWIAGWDHPPVVEGAATVLPYVPNDVLRLFYKGASLFLYPSMWEGYGLPIYESLNIGTPVLVSRPWAEGAIVTRDDTVEGWRDAIVNYFSNAARAGVSFKGNTWGEAARHYLGLYGQAFTEGGAP